MLTLAIIVGIAQGLVFKGLTVAKLFTWFNVHPFVSLIMLKAIFSQHNYTNIKFDANKFFKK